MNRSVWIVSSLFYDMYSSFCVYIFHVQCVRTYFHNGMKNMERIASNFPSSTYNLHLDNGLVVLWTIRMSMNRSNILLSTDSANWNWHRHRWMLQSAQAHKQYWKWNEFISQEMVSSMNTEFNFIQTFFFLYFCFYLFVCLLFGRHLPHRKLEIACTQNNSSTAFICHERK